MSDMPLSNLEAEKHYRPARKLLAELSLTVPISR